MKVELYGEALCPYCMRFTSTIVAPLFKQGVGSIFNFSCRCNLPAQTCFQQPWASYGVLKQSHGTWTPTVPDVSPRSHKQTLPMEMH